MAETITHHDASGMTLAELAEFVATATGVDDRYDEIRADLLHGMRRHGLVIADEDDEA